LSLFLPRAPAIRAASVGWAKARSAVPTSASTQTASQPWARFALPTLVWGSFCQVLFLQHVTSGFAFSSLSVQFLCST
jgi:hypothetical protein